MSEHANPIPGKTRIRLERTVDPHTLLRPGDVGTFVLIDDYTGVWHVRWDVGSTLGLVPGEDAWTVLEGS